MIARALGKGFRLAAGRPGLVTLLWAWNLALALLVAVPFWTWVTAASRLAPATDPLLDGLDIGLLAHLLVTQAMAAPILLLGVVALAIVSLLSGSFLSGGLLEIALGEGDGRGLLPRFFQGAGAFFGRFTRLLALAGLTLVVVVGPVSAALAALASLLTDGGTEASVLAGSLAVQGLVVLAVLYVVAVLDYARAMTVLTGNRGMTRTWLRAMVFVLRHLLPVAGIGLIAAAGVGAAVGASLAHDASYGARSWSAILGAIAVQQAMAWVRTAVRVGQVTAQATYCAERLPMPAPAAPAPPWPVPPEPPEPGLGAAPATGPTSEGTVERAVAGPAAPAAVGIPDKTTQED